MGEIEPSKSAVRRAGSTIRKFSNGECSRTEFNSALDVITAYRASFVTPLNTVLAALNIILDPDEVEGKATHRLKKIPTVVSKLSREPGLDLSRMQDLGGCRVVFNNVDDLYFFADKIRGLWGGAISHEKDYIKAPRDSGYRGVHIVVIQDSKSIEIQLRTKVMHTWAELVEAFSAVTKVNLKQDGSHLIQEFMKLNSRLGATEEGLATPPITQHELDRLSILRDQVEHYLDELRTELERKL